MYVKSMEKFLSKENNAVASWFLGPRAENSYFVQEFYKEITDKHAETRRMQYFPEDPLFITKDMQNSDEYKSNIRSLRAQLQNLSDSLAEKTVPFWSPRHMGHMVTESTMPGHLAYVAALQYNQNNIAIEGSPLTTWLEVFAGKQLCEMLGFTVHWNTNESKDAIYDQSDTSLEQPPKIQGWGHITADGSVANLESMWAARNLKFYPLSLRLAVDDGLLSFIGSSFKVELANSKETKLLKECTTWELLNLKPTTILDIPDQLYNQYGITPQFLQHALYEYTIQTVGKDQLERKFNITEPTLYFTSATAHYSWAKGCAIVGIGSNNLIPVTVDNAARMDMKELDKHLSKCVEKKQAVYAVVAIMGSTEQGACDPLADIVKLREKYEREHGLSFVIHGDAAWGGYFRSMLVKPPVSSQKVRRREGLEEGGDSFVPKLALHPYTERHLDSMKYCDSVTADPHKSGFIPFPAGSLCYRDQRMRYMNTWKSPVVVRNNDVSTGVYGIEGSKPGTAPAAAWLSHNAIGLHQKGYGLLLGQSTFSCTKLYCHWSTMSTEKDDFIVIPFNMLPAEKLIPPNPVEVKKQKEEIRLRIVRKSNIEIINDDFAMELVKKIGSDLMINTFACNFKVDGKINEDVVEANYLNERLFERFSLTNVKGKNSNKPIILTSTQFKQKNYQGCLTNFKNRLGLKGDQDLYVLINVVMSPWVTEFEFHRQLATTFKEALQDLVKLSVKRNKVEPDHHVFVMQGTKKLYLTNLPMFQMENHRQQVIITADLPRRIKYKYLDARRKNPSHVYYLGNQDVMTLDDIARDGASFKGVIYKDFDKASEKPIVWIKDFRVTNVQVIKKRHLATRFQDANYPSGHVPFYLYGTNQELHIDHMLLKSPSIQLSADRVKLDLTVGKLTTLQRERGVVVHFTNVNELAMQPFPVIKPFPQAEPPKAPKTTPNPFPPIIVPPFPIIPPPKRFDDSFFFQGDRTFHVELYEDPIFNPYQSGPGLDNVKEPFAKGTIRLPTRKEGSLYTDSYLINEDPTRSSPIEPSINYFHEKFNRKDELYWYEEMDE